jgi:hypothetical protein
VGIVQHGPVIVHRNVKLGKAGAAEGFRALSLLVPTSATCPHTIVRPIDWPTRAWYTECAMASRPGTGWWHASDDEVAEDRPSFGSLLRSYRQRAEVSQAELWRRLAVRGYPIAAGALPNYEKGIRLPNDPEIISVIVECLEPLRSKQRPMIIALVEAYLLDSQIRVLEKLRPVLDKLEQE